MRGAPFVQGAVLEGGCFRDGGGECGIIYVLARTQHEFPVLRPIYAPLKPCAIHAIGHLRSLVALVSPAERCVAVAMR